MSDPSNQVLQKSGKDQRFLSRLIDHSWLEPALLVLMLVVFTVCASYFAFHLHKAIIPDEPGHFYISTLFASTWGTPQVTDYSLALGNIQFNREPYLFYWINGRFLNLINMVFPGVSEWRQLIFLRLISVLFSLLTVLYTYLLSKEIITNRWWRLLPVFLVTNTLMFVFLSGGASYDNLANLSAAAGAFYLVRVLKGKKFISNSLLWVIAIGVGILTKKTILPLAAVMILVWLVFIIKNRRMLNFKAEFNWILAVLAGFTLLIVGLNVYLYGVNIVKYRQPIPDCAKIFTQTQCDLSVFVRRAKDMNFPAQKLTLGQVFDDPDKTPLNYFLEYWLRREQTTIYGIMGHQAYYPAFLITFFRFLYFLIILVAVRYWIKRDFLFYSLLLLVLSYLLVIFIQSYNEELMSNFQHVAIQGRYLFPILAPFYVLVTLFISGITNKILRKVTLAYTLILSFVSGPVMFLLLFAGTNHLDWFI